MFEGIMNFFKKMTKKEDQTLKSKNAAKERLHLVLMQDRANVSADFLDLMKQEIIEVIKKYIDIDESAMDVRLTNKENGDGTNGAPALYANIPIVNIKDEARKNAKVETSNSKKSQDKPKENESKENDNKKQDKNRVEQSKQDKNLEAKQKKSNKDQNDEIIKHKDIKSEEENKKNENNKDKKE